MRVQSPWLTLAGQALNLAADRALLGALGRIAADATGAQAAADPADLARLLADPRLADALVGAGDRASEARARIERLSQRLAKAGDTQAMALLRRPMDSLGGTVGAGPIRLDWHPLGTLGQAGALASGALGLALTEDPVLHLGLGGEPEPGETLPQGTVPLTLSVSGGLAAGHGIDFPVRLGRLGLSGASREGMSLAMRFALPSDAILASSLADCLGALPSPFDLTELGPALAGGGLLSLGLESEGEVSVAGRLAFGLGAQATRAARAGAGLGARFTVTRSGRFRMQVRAGAEPGSVRLDLARTRAQQGEQGIAVGLTLGISGLLDELRPSLLAQLGGARGLIDSFDAFLPPSRFLGRRIRAALGDARAGPGAPNAPEAPDLGRLAERLASAIDRQPGLWREDAERVVHGVLAGLSEAGESEPSGDSAQGQALRPLLEPVVRGLVLTLRQGLDAEIRRRTADPVSLARLRDKLAAARVAAGAPHGLSPGAGPAAVAESVRARLSDLQLNLSGLVGALERSSTLKLEAGWRRELREDDSSDMRQSLLFRPAATDSAQGAADPARLYAQALAGSFDAAFESALALGDEGGAAAPVLLLDGSLTRFAGVDRRSGFGLALLDFELGSESLLSARVEIRTDAAGNIRVLARSESEVRDRGLFERRTWRCVNVYELASASATRNMTLSMSLLQEDKSLHRRELDTFLRGLKDPRIGLLSPAAAEQALAALARVAGPEEARVAGDLRLWMGLDDAAVRRLLQLPPRSGPEPGPDATPGNPTPGRGLDLRAVYAVAVEALQAGLAATGSRATNNNLSQFVATRAGGRDLRRVLLDLDDEGERQAMRPHPAEGQDLVGDGATYDILIRLSDRARGLAEALELMRRVYLGNPDWGPAEYREAQRAIDDRLRPWAEGQPADRGLFSIFGSDKLRPYTLAFFRALAILVRPDPAAGTRGLLGASLVLARDGRELTVPLAEPAGSLADLG